MTNLYFIGMDVHKESITATVFSQYQDKAIVTKILPYEYSSIKRFIKKYNQNNNSSIAGYEAGSMGFDLYRKLSSAGLRCVILAPKEISKKPGRKIKNDKRDSIEIAKILKLGDYSLVHIPCPDDESVRDLLRARADMKLDCTRNKQQLHKYLLRHGYIFESKKYWTKAHNKWLKGLIFDHVCAQETFNIYYYRIQDLTEQIKNIDEKIKEIAQSKPYEKAVNKLRSLKGVDYLTALSFICEVGDFRRFKSAPHFMSYLGLVPGEYSSGSRRRPRSITKAGNTHLRKLLIESSWHYRYKTYPTKRLTVRWKNIPDNIINYSKKAINRLHKLFYRIILKGKPSQIAVTAVARELAGFIWGLMVNNID